MLDTHAPQPTPALTGLLADPSRIAMIREHAAARDLVIEICAESGRAWLIDRKEPDTEQALVAEVLCPRTEPLQGIVRDEVPDLLAYIDQLRAELVARLTPTEGTR